jgi:hypothetical protein
VLEVEQTPKQPEEPQPTPLPEETPVKEITKDTTFSSLTETIDVVASDRTALDPSLYGESVSLSATTD